MIEHNICSFVNSNTAHTNALLQNTNKHPLPKINKCLIRSSPSALAFKENNCIQHCERSTVQKSLQDIATSLMNSYNIEPNVVTQPGNFLKHIQQHGDIQRNEIAISQARMPLKASNSKYRTLEITIFQYIFNVIPPGASYFLS